MNVMYFFPKLKDDLVAKCLRILCRYINNDNVNCDRKDHLDILRIILIH